MSAIKTHRLWCHTRYSELDAPHIHVIQVPGFHGVRYSMVIGIDVSEEDWNRERANRWNDGWR